MKGTPVVYIVDDDAAARESVSAMAASKGLAVRGYASAEEFLEDFDRNSLACLLTDVRMAGMNGLELQENLRAAGCKMPVIVITGYGDVPSAVSAFRGGAVTFLEKPCVAQELCALIVKSLHDYRLRREEEREKREIIARFEKLSPSEWEVMEAMIDGKPNKAIASELLMGLRTVELRRAEVMKKMKAKSLPDLVRMCVMNGVRGEQKPETNGELKGCFG